MRAADLAARSHAGREGQGGASASERPAAGAGAGQELESMDGCLAKTAPNKHMCIGAYASWLNAEGTSVIFF